MKNWHIILAMAILFARVETSFFGSDFWPQTWQEMAFLTRAVEGRWTR